jgi:hypothetical protein
LGQLQTLVIQLGLLRQLALLALHRMVRHLLDLLDQEVLLVLYHQ